MKEKNKKSTEKLLSEISEKLDKIFVAIIISNKEDKEKIKILKKFKNKWSIRDIEKWSGIDRHKFSKKTKRNR